MKKSLFLLCFGLLAIVTYAKSPVQVAELQVVRPVVGGVFEIGVASGRQFQHIHFPRANFINKRGGVANYKGMENLKVVVTSVKELKNGSTKVHVKRVDGKRFFGSHVYVAADVKAALESGELR